MSMPTIPEEKFRPTKREVFIDLLESIALEENALAHLLNAEAEKIQAFVGKHLNFPTHPTTNSIIRFNQSTNQLLEVVVMKEFLLLRKLEQTLQLQVEEHEVFEE